MSDIHCFVQGCPVREPERLSIYMPLVCSHGKIQVIGEPVRPRALKQFNHGGDRMRNRLVVICDEHAEQQMEAEMEEEDDEEPGFGGLPLAP